MHRIEVNVQTGAVTQVELTAEEIAEREKAAQSVAQTAHPFDIIEDLKARIAALEAK